MSRLLRRLSHLERLLGRCPDQWHETVRHMTVYGPDDPFDRDQTPPEIPTCSTCHEPAPTVHIRYVRNWRNLGEDNTPAPTLN